MLLAITIFVLVLYVFLGFKTPRFAIITLPFIASFLVIFSASNEEPVPAIVSLCIFPAALISILFMRHEADIVPWPKSWAKAILILLICIALLVLFSVTVSSIIGLYMGMFMAGMFCYCVGVAVTQRNAVVAFVISTIGASVRQNLPLPMALQSASENIKFKHSQILRRISKWLVQGYSLAESIKRGFRRCPARITALIEAGEKTGQVPQVLESIEADLLEKSSESKRLKPIYPAAYFAIVIIFLLVVTLWIVSGVVPKFTEVIRELAGAGLPRSTKILVQISNFLYFGGVRIIPGTIFTSLLGLRFALASALDPATT